MKQHKWLNKLLLGIIILIFGLTGIQPFRETAYNLDISYTALIVVFTIVLYIQTELIYLYNCLTSKNKIFDWINHKLVSFLFAFVGLILVRLLIMPIAFLKEHFILLLQLIWILIINFVVAIILIIIAISVAYIIYIVGKVFINANRGLAILIRGEANVKGTLEQIKRQNRRKRK